MKRVVTAIAAIILEGWLHGAEPTVEASALPFSAPTEPGDAQATFAIETNLRIELVASEPLIEAPVAMAWDADGWDEVR